MKKILAKLRNKKVIALVLATTLLCCTSLTAFASWYGFSHDVTILGGDNILYDAEYTGTNVGGDVWTSVDTAHIAYEGKPYTFYIQKKGWWVWQWDTVASETCYYGRQGTVKAYNCGDGRYRFVLKASDFLKDEGITAYKFESYSWD